MCFFFLSLSLTPELCLKDLNLLEANSLIKMEDGFILNPTGSTHLGTPLGSTVEPLYCGHLGDLVKCPVYSGAPLLWAPWGPGEVSCIQWNRG